jgi:hypothetical protein
MAVWADWYGDLLVHAQRCPKLIIKHEIKRAAQEFYTRTRAWSVLTSAHAVAAGQSDVTVVLGTGLEIARIEDAWLDGRRLDPATVHSMGQGYSDDWTAQTGTPTHAVLLTPGIVRLFPTPTGDAATGLKLRVSVRPSDGATGIPDDLFAAHRLAIAYGARSALMAYAGRPWSNEKMAGVWASAFGEAIATAASAANRGHQQARPRTRIAWC